MISFKVDSTSAKVFDGCNTCCCEQVAIRHMSSEQIAIDFSPWCTPIAPRGLKHTDVHVEVLNKPTELSYNVASMYSLWNQDAREPLYINKVKQHDGQEIIYKYLSQYPTKSRVDNNGELINLANTEYFYSKNPDWGQEDLYAAHLVQKLPAGAPQPPKEYLRWQTQVFENSVLLLNVWLTPFAYVGHVLRLAIAQNAEDCDCQTYTKNICIDITVVRC